MCGEALEIFGAFPGKFTSLQFGAVCVVWHGDMSVAFCDLNLFHSRNDTCHSPLRSKSLIASDGLEGIGKVLRFATIDVDICPDIWRIAIASRTHSGKGRSMAVAGSVQTKSQFADGRILSEKGPVRIADIRANLGISRERMGRVLDVSARTIQRWEDSDQLPANRWVLQVLIQLQNIVDIGLEVFTPDGLHRVMTNPQPGFDNHSGLDLIEAGEGLRVFGELVSADEGYLGR